MAKHPAHISEKDSGFGRSNHPVVPDGRVVHGPKSTLPAERQSTGHVVKKLDKP
jgi:hypothetical protein